MATLQPHLAFKGAGTSGRALYDAAHGARVEYAGPFAAALLFLEAKGAVAPIASGLAVFGQLAYYWPRVFMANSSKSQIGGFNNGFPFYVPAAVARYVALGMLTYKIYGIVA